MDRVRLAFELDASVLRQRTRRDRPVAVAARTPRGFVLLASLHPRDNPSCAAAGELVREGTPVRYVRMTFLPDDETCFHIFEAASEEAVGEACRRAGIGERGDGDERGGSEGERRAERGGDDDSAIRRITAREFSWALGSRSTTVLPRVEK